MVFLWLRQPVIYDYEFGLTKKLSEIEYSTRMGKVKYRDEYKKKFLFVNTAHSLITDDEVAENEPNVRTNPAQLATVLENLYQHKNLYDIIFLDVYFPFAKSKEDSALISIVHRLQEAKKIVTVTQVLQEEPQDNEAHLPDWIKIFQTYKDNTRLQVNPNMFGNQFSAPAFYPLSNIDAFYKFIYNIEIDGKLHKEAPLLMYENIKQQTANSPFMMGVFYRYKGNSSIYQNIYPPRIILTDEQLEWDKKEHFGNRVNLDFLADFGEESLVLRLKDGEKKIIFIGDLVYGDNHTTAQGKIKGILIVANALIALLENTNQLSYAFLVFLFFLFALISYLTFYTHHRELLKKEFVRNPLLNKMIIFVIERANYLILFLGTLVGIFIFNHYLFLLFNTIYLFLLEKIIGWYRDKNFVKNRVSKKD